MVVLGRLAAVVHADLQDCGIVDRELSGAPHPDVVIGWIADVEARDDGRAGGKLRIAQIHGVGLRHRIGGGFVVGVDLARFEGREHRIGIGAVVDPLDTVEPEVAFPPWLVLAADLGANLGVPRHQFARSSGDRQRLQRIAFAIVAAMHDQRWIVGQAGNQRNVGLRQIEPDGKVVDTLDAAVDRFLGGGVDQRPHALGDRIAGNARIAPARQVVDDVVGVEGVAVRPGDALADMQRQHAGVVTGLPALEQPRLEGEIAIPAHQIFVALAGDVGHLNAVEGARILPALDVHGDAQDAAAPRLFGRPGRRGRKAAERQRAGGADAKCGHGGKILAPVHAALLEAVGDGLGLRMQRSVGQHELHRRILPVGARSTASRGGCGRPARLWPWAMIVRA